MNKTTRALLGFIIGFLVGFGGCATQFPNPLAPGPILGGCLLGALFALVAILLGGDEKK